MNIWWDWHALALVRRDWPRGCIQMFALRCSLCRRLTCGCREHYFCGLCEPCRSVVEDGHA